MSIDPKQVNKIATLARLQIEPEDIALYSQNLSDILQLVEQMNQVDTNGIGPMAHPLDMHQRLREDSITETDQHELFQRNAPVTQDDLYLVPQVIEYKDKE